MLNLSARVLRTTLLVVYPHKFRFHDDDCFSCGFLLKYPYRTISICFLFAFRGFSPG